MTSITPVFAQENRLHAIEYLAPNDPIEDLDFLSDYFQETTIVGAGEATHGTKDFFQMKHRIFKYLVTQQQFNVFAIEANFGNVLAINDFITKGIGDPYELVYNIGFWTFSTFEVLELVKWMREYNTTKKPEDQIHIYGLDIQNPIPVAQNLRNILERNNYNLSDADISTLMAFDDFFKMNSKERKALKAKFKKFKKSYSKKSIDKFQIPSYTRGLLSHAFTSIFQAFKWQKKNKLNMHHRDKLMAENIQWIIDQEKQGTKIFIWGHNSHLSSRSYLLGSSLGKHLRRAYGSEYYALGFSFSKGTFTAIDAERNMLRSFKIESQSPTDIGLVFDQSPASISFMDFRHLNKKSDLYKQLKKKRTTISIGSTYHKKYHYEFTQKLLKHYDGIIHFKTTHPSQVLPKNR
ncbi:succinoglycan biosynthesis [Echinicola rosea]|uniref:Succinoglycan biosynthesis n=1 Tax=Echinicola rosea TaxID=1807691 RepID=A0ABQ1V6I9_9BACT|nr:succinoglycan biosynthesis [Echinicola rosea]